MCFLTLLKAYTDADVVWPLLGQRIKAIRSHDRQFEINTYLLN